MSGSGGSAAGHTHSQQPTNGQPDAHDQNRGAFANWVSSHSGAAPTDEKEAAVMAGAIGVGSMAPAAVARSNGVDGGVRDQQAAASWEADREDAKAKVNGAFLTLPPAAQSRVTTTMQGFMSGVSGAPGTVTERALATDSALVLPTSPRRDTTTPSAPGFLKGGNYNGSPPQYVPPMGGTGAQMSANMTEPFRTEKSK
jgi:hypothetical protein